MMSAVGHLAKLLEGVRAPWAIVGSCNLYLRTYASTPNDIDVITNRDGVAEIYDRLVRYASTPLSHSEAGNVRSHFFRAVANGVTVEVMGDPENRVHGEWIKNTLWVESIEHMCIGNVAVPLTTLFYERHINQQLGNQSRVQEIEGCIKNTKGLISQHGGCANNVHF